jgi:hypothetical protein
LRAERRAVFGLGLGREANGAAVSLGCGGASAVGSAVDPSCAAASTLIAIFIAGMGKAALVGRLDDGFAA